jgi:molybdenum cofactor cytidylyltransferase
LRLRTALRVKKGDVVAFTGGGGKSTAMFQLANELAGEWRVLTTTTTRIFAAQIGHAPAHTVFDPAHLSETGLVSELSRAIVRHGQVLLVGGADYQSGKAAGVSPQLVNRLSRSGAFDVILVEADGSRMRPLKAPAEHEPVIPASTTIVVPVVGLDVLHQPLNDQMVHRAERVAILARAGMNRPVSPELIKAVLCHPHGGLKHVPPPADVFPLLNKVETTDRLAAARDISVSLLECNRISAVLTGSVQNKDIPINRVYHRDAVIILAAGGSSRFGEPKQLVRRQGNTMLETVIDTALRSQARPVIVVLGAYADRCRQVIGTRPVQVVVNQNWATGQSSSMQVGLGVLPSNVAGATFMLADQPTIPAEVINALIDRHQQSLAPVVWPEYNGQRGNPVLFDRSLFPELTRVSGDTGGRPVLQRFQSQAERVRVNTDTVLRDIDRPEDMTH